MKYIIDPSKKDNNPEFDIGKSFDQLKQRLNSTAAFDPWVKINLDKEKLKSQSQHAQIESVEILKNIEANTEYLKTMVELVHENNTNQEEILNTIKQILDIASA